MLAEPAPGTYTSTLAAFRHRSMAPVAAWVARRVANTRTSLAWTWARRRLLPSVSIEAAVVGIVDRVDLQEELARSDELIEEARALRARDNGR